MSEEALDGRGAASLLPRYEVPSEHVPAALRKRRVHVPHLGQGATGMVKSAALGDASAGNRRLIRLHLKAGEAALRTREEA